MLQHKNQPVWHTTWVDEGWTSHVLSPFDHEEADNVEFAEHEQSLPRRWLSQSVWWCRRNAEIRRQAASNTNSLISPVPIQQQETFAVNLKSCLRKSIKWKILKSSHYRKNKKQFCKEDLSNSRDTLYSLIAMLSIIKIFPSWFISYHNFNSSAGRVFI